MRDFWDQYKRSASLVLGLMGLKNCSFITNI